MYCLTTIDILSKFSDGVGVSQVKFFADNIRIPRNFYDLLQSCISFLHISAGYDDPHA